MKDIKDEIWEKQIGNNKSKGTDFSGREIHYTEFNNYDSPYGWTLISFGQNEFLIVHVKTEQEFPENVVDDINSEFQINGKTFSVSKNIHGDWDVNLVEYDEKFIPDFRTINVSLNTPNKKNEYELFNNIKYNDTTGYVNLDNETLKQQRMEIERLQKQLADEQTHQLEIQKQQNILRDKKSDSLLKEQLKQRQEIERLESELEFQKIQNQKSEIARNNIKLNELKEEIARTQTINAASLEEFNIEKYRTNLDNTSFNSSSKNQKKINNIQNLDIDFFDESLINDLTRKLNEQTQQITLLKKDQQDNAKKISEIELVKSKQNMFLNKQAEENWNRIYGNSNFANDFAGRVIVKNKFNLDEEGGWNIDYYDYSKSIDSFIASKLTIKERAGKQKFSIDGKGFIVENQNGKWQIIRHDEKEFDEYSSKNLTDIANEFKPNKEESFNGNYESYSSLVINLYHFPLACLDKFEEFLKQSLSNLSFFKEIFIYSNERVYNNNESNISAYARVFFKSSSTKNDVEILLTSINLKKAMTRFISNFSETNRERTISFSMVLYNHQKYLKFVHAQSNFELLRIHPIPSKIPFNQLILDKEYNLILKFHENNLWKKLKPYALDYKGNVYYVCDIDGNSVDVHFINQ